MLTSFQPKSTKQRGCVHPTAASFAVGVNGRDLHVTKCAKNQMVSLEDKANMFPARSGQLIGRKVGGVLPVDEVIAFVWYVKATHYVH